MSTIQQKKSNDFDYIEQDICSFLNNNRIKSSTGLLDDNLKNIQVTKTNSFFDREIGALICSDIENKIYDEDYNECLNEYCIKNGLTKDATFTKEQIQEFQAELREKLKIKYGNNNTQYKLVDFVNGSFEKIDLENSYNYKDNGCQAGVYEINGEYVVVCRGTEFKGTAKEFYKDFIERDVMELGYDKIPTDFYLTKDLLDYTINNFANGDMSKVHIVGHSLGASTAQLLGALNKYKNIDVTTYNAAGVKHLLNNQELISEGLQSNAEKASNIVNYVTSNDWVSLIFDIIGQDVQIVKPADRDVSKEYLSQLLSENLINVEDAVYLSIITEEKYAENGHQIENFISSGSFQAFIPDKKDFLPKTVSFIVEHLFFGNDNFSLMVGKLVGALTKSIDSKLTLKLMKIFGTDTSDLNQPQSYRNIIPQTLYGSVTMEYTPDEFDYLCKVFIEAGFKFVAKLIDKDNNINFYIEEKFDKEKFETLVSDYNYIEGYFDGYEVIYNKNYEKDTIYLYKEKDSSVESIQNFLNYSNNLQTAVLNDDIYGNSTIIGDNKENFIEGLNGKTIAYAGEGNDVVIGADGQDKLHGQEGDDILIAGNTQMSKEEIKNLLSQKDNINVNDFISENGIGSELNGESGNDLLIGDKGDDYLDGGANDDYIYGGAGDDNIKGGSGNDKLYGGQGNDILNGGEGDDELNGDDNDDKLIAGSGSDTLTGGNGNDLLCNYSDSAMLIGGSGYDTYDISSGASNIIIDSDNSGSVCLNGQTLFGAGKDFYLQNNMWSINGITYTWSGNILNINGSTTIQNFSNGALGIYLEKPEEEPEEDDGEETDPILFDLNGDGIQTTVTQYQGRNYDYNNDGFAEKIAWADNGDGVLVADANNDGEIQGSSDIVLASTLKEYDTNSDGVVDANDANFNNLKIMKVDGSVLSMEEAGISSIDITNIHHQNNIDEHGNTITHVGTYTTTDGNVHEYGEYYLKTDSKLSVELNKMEETETVAALPDIANSGKVHSLHQAMLRDETLQTLVTSFKTETNDAVRMNLVEQILLKWTGSESVEEGSRGEFINAQSLAVLEAFDGKEFYSTYEASVGNPNPQNPNKEAANILRTQYEVLKNEIYANLMQQTHLQTYYDAIDTTELRWNLSPVVALLQTAIEQDEATGRDLVYQVAKMIKGLGIDNYSNFFNPKDDECFYLKFTKDDRELKWLIDTIGKVPYTDEIGDGEGSAADDSYRLDEQGHFHALSGDDVAYGSNENDSFAMCNGDDLVDGGDGDDILDTHGGNDIVFGGTGNDLIRSSDGNDIIFGDDGDDTILPDHSDDFNIAQDGNDTIRGGKGNDTIRSMVGDDTFIFYRGDGQDVVFEHQGTDTLYFGPDITWNDLIFEQADNDMIIKIKDSDDQITVKDWFAADEDGVYRYNNHKIEIFEFADGSKHYKNEITVGDNTESITYNMNEYDDYIELTSNYKTTVNLRDGWNHIVAGKNSDDTYVLNTEHSNVLIQDYDGNNTIKFGDGIQLAQTFFAYSQDGLEVNFENFDAYMRIQGDTDNFKFEFSDGTVITDINALFQRDISYTDYIMSENLEELRLLGHDSITVIDNDSNSNIITNNGDTTIDFGQGHTYVESHNGGNDTYIYNLGDCDKHISDFGGIDTIKFGEGITTENIHFLKNLETNELEIWFDLDYDNNDRLTIENFFGDNNNIIEAFEFADGSVIDNVEEYIKAWGSKNDEDLQIPDNIAEVHLRGEGHITATGNDNDNWLGGNEGDNSFIGGKGNDNYWDDCKTNERYYYNVGDGHDNIDDIGGIDAIIFGEGITKENIRFTREPENLIIWFDGIPDSSIHIQNYFADDERKIELFKFADGSVIDNIEPYIREVVSRDNDIVLSETQENAFLWDNANLNVTGNQYDNYIEGNEGNNIIEAKGGDDAIQNFGGDDTYIYNIGDGKDLILDHGGFDTIKFGEGITSQNIIFEKINNDLNVKFEGNEGSILVLNYFVNESDNKIEVFEFADGTQITDISGLYAEVESQENNNENQEPNIPQNNYDHLQNGSIVMNNDETDVVLTGNKDAYVLGNNNDNNVTGNAGNNTYALGAGNDTVIDTQGGDDTYHYNFNNGHDVITDIGGIDTIKFGRNISPDGLRFEQAEHNLVISFRDEWRYGSLTINDYFLDENHKIENFVFDDGTVLNDISDRITGIAAFENHTMEENANIEIVRMAGTENISVTGNSQNNIIEGNSGNNTFEGKGGDDILVDISGGNDTYIYNIGDGNDTIIDVGGYDTIKFGPEVTLENLAFEKTSTDLNIWFHNIENNGLCIRDFFSNPENKIEKFELSDGTVITDISNYITAIGSENDVTLPNGVSQIHLWGEKNTTATGNDIDNWIGGNDGDNTIIGGKGNDYLYDDRNTNETYIYNLGDGDDCINDFGGYDVIKFGEGITKDNLVFIMNNGDLLINFKDNDGNMLDGSIRIEGHFWDDNRKIERIEFADASFLTNLDRYITILAGENDVQNHWSFPEVHIWGEQDTYVRGNYNDEVFFGNNGNNTYDPQGGTDRINAGTGNDTYIYNHDYQNKFIIDMGGEDVIKFGSGIDLENTKFVRNDNNLRIYFQNNGNGFIQIEDYFGSDERKIERFEFADGNVITDVTNDLIKGAASYGNITLNENDEVAYLLGDSDSYVIGNDAENNFINGNSGNNTYNGRKGHDHIEDRNGGDDTYIYNIGDGHDYIVDIGGNDVVKFGDGISLENVRFTHRRNDLQVFVDIGENGGSIQIENYFKSDLRKIERFEFADGTVITDVSGLISGITIDSDYTFDEDTQITEVYMKGRDNLSVTGNSRDSHIEGNEGNNIYNLKGGNDDVYDPDGDDTYIYNLGDGYEFYNDENGFDTLKLGEGITQDIIRMERQDNGNLNIWFDGYEGNICFCEHFWNYNKRLERIIFADGTEITDFTPFMPYIEVDSDYTISEEGTKNDVDIIGENDVTVTGNSQDNHVNGNNANNTYNLKGGNDSVFEPGGNDTYIYNLGDGWDFITDLGGNDKIVLGEGITQDIIRMRRQWNGNLEIYFDGQEGNIVIQDYFNNNDNKIEKIVLADNTEITDFEQFFNFEVADGDYTLPEDSNKNEIVIANNGDISVNGNSKDNHFEGNIGNNTYQGNAGNDDVYDPDGDDTYIYNLGDGYEFYNDDNGFDTLKFGEGITQDIIRMEQQDNGNLLITFDGKEGSICFCEHFWNDNKKLERIIFADGTEITDFTPFMPYIEVDSDYTLPEDGIKRDIIVNGGNDITINGNSQNNYIEINTQGNVTVQGNAGNDYVQDNAGGNTTYIYNQGDGWNTIRDCSGYDTVKFGDGLNVFDMKVMNRNGNGLEIWFDGVDGNLVIEDCLVNPDNKIERFEFADGTIIENIEDYMNCIASENNIELPEGYKEAHLWGENDTSATGNDQDNHFNGNSGNNRFEGKKGNDSYWDDQGGDDTYVYNLGDGYDNIANIRGYDTIQFGIGITENMLRFEKCDNGDLEIFIDADTEENCGSIRIQNHFNDDEWKIEKVMLSDGTEITDFNSRVGIIEVDSDYTIPENGNIKDVIIVGENDVSVTGNSQDNHVDGNNANNTYDLKGGNDYVFEPGGNDTYIHNIGDGWNTIRDCSGYDTVKFGEGLNVSDMKVMNRDGHSLEIWFDGVDGNLVIEDCLVNPDNKIEKFEFADGTVIDNIEDYMNCIASENNIELPEGYKEAHLWGENDTSATGNNQDNHFNGNPGNNKFEGKKGNDSYWDDQGGDDTFIYNLGDGYDNIANIRGYDTIQFGIGITENMLRFEKCENGDFEIFIDADTEENCGSIRIQNHFNDNEWKIEKVILSDGTEITDFNSRLGIIEVDSDYTIPENGDVKDVVIVGENNVSVTGNSQDNHINGSFANNTYDLKGGNDNVFEPGGNDTYIYNSGDGNDYINDQGGNDTVQFGTGITRDMVSFMQDDYNNMHIRINNEQGGEILVEGQYHNSGQGIEKVQFADGTVLTDINSLTTEIGTEFNNIVLPDGYLQAHLWGNNNLNATGNSLDNFMRGNAGDNILEGKGGNDSYWELEGGNDTYIYNIGDGHDYINDVGGYDKIVFGDGIVDSMLRMERCDNGDLQIFIDADTEENCGSIKIQDYFNNNDSMIERFEFANGVFYTDISIFIGPTPGQDIDPIDPTNPDEPIDEEVPVLSVTDNNDFDVNLLIQEINAYGVDNEVVMTESQVQNNEELVLAMVS